MPTNTLLIKIFRRWSIPTHSNYLFGRTSRQWHLIVLTITSFLITCISCRQSTPVNQGSLNREAGTTLRYPGINPAAQGHVLDKYVDHNYPYHHQDSQHQTSSWTMARSDIWAPVLGQRSKVDATRYQRPSWHEQQRLGYGPRSTSSSTAKVKRSPITWNSLEVTSCYGKDSNNTLSSPRTNHDQSKWRRSRSINHHRQQSYTAASSSPVYRKHRVYPRSSRLIPFRRLHVNNHRRIRRRHRLGRVRQLRSTSQWVEQQLNQDPLITIHKVSIRPSRAVVENGQLKVGLGYVAQLHKQLTGFYKLETEVRLSQSSDPVFVNTVNNMCAYWSAIESTCSTNRNWFYQHGQLCLCHMPVGIYQQRLRVSTNQLVEMNDMMKYMIESVFRGSKISIFVKFVMKQEDDKIVACTTLKVPIHLKSL